jgi:RING finger protein 121
MGDQAHANSRLQGQDSLLQAADDAHFSAHNLTRDDPSYHEPTEEELRHSLLIFYIFLFVVVLAQSVLVHWRKTHKRSYELVTLIGMWIVPPIISIFGEFWRFIAVSFVTTNINFKTFSVSELHE